jgi:hypothetical protein
MTDDNLLPFSFPTVACKKVTADFDGGRLTSDSGVMLLSMAERRIGVAERLARCFPDRRDPARITRTLADMIRARIFTISYGYEDADDLDFLRADPAFKRTRPIRTAVLRIKRLRVSHQWRAPSSRVEAHGAGS